MMYRDAIEYWVRVVRSARAQERHAHKRAKRAEQQGQPSVARANRRDEELAKERADFAADQVRRLRDANKIWGPRRAS